MTCILSTLLPFYPPSSIFFFPTSRSFSSFFSKFIPPSSVHFILFSLFQVSNAASSDWLIPASGEGDDWPALAIRFVVLLLHWLSY